MTPGAPFLFKVALEQVQSNIIHIGSPRGEKVLSNVIPCFKFTCLAESKLAVNARLSRGGVSWALAPWRRALTGPGAVHVERPLSRWPNCSSFRATCPYSGSNAQISIKQKSHARGALAGPENLGKEWRMEKVELVSSWGKE